METNLTKILKELIWYSLANSTLEDVSTVSLNDTKFLEDVKMRNNATLHIRKKHFSPIVKKVVNDLFANHHYAVSSVKYRFHGMDILVSPK